MSKQISCLTRKKIEGEAAKSAEDDSKTNGCMRSPYDGAKGEIWIKAYKEAQDES